MKLDFTLKDCDAFVATPVHHHFAYGDPLPVYARYYADNEKGFGPRDDEDLITVYIHCERELGHKGKHLARGFGAWEAK